MKLRSESDDIDKELRQLYSKKNDIAARDRQFKDILNKMKKNPPSSEELTQLADKFN